jgi:hypothetical protein
MIRPRRANRPGTRRRAAGLRVEALERREVLTTLTVTSLADAGPGTLRAAITQANAGPGFDTITFAPGLTGTIGLLSALPALAKPMTITGPGASKLTVARDATAPQPFGIFGVNQGATVVLSGLTISGGGGNPAQGFEVLSGGAGIGNGGTLTVVGCVIRDNHTAAVDFEPEGGGIDNFGTLTLLDSTVVDNGAVGTGFGDLHIPFANGHGGGINNQGTALIARSTISGNQAGRSGGGLSNEGTMTLIDVTVSGNRVTSVFANATFPDLPQEIGGRGGGVVNSGRLTVFYSTVTANRATGAGGGIANLDAFQASPTSSAGVLVLADTIVAGNLGSLDGVNNAVVDISGTPPDSDIVGAVAPGSVFNVIGDLVGPEANASGLVNGLGGNRVGTTAAPLDARLGPLADNGGPTQTHALLPGSPALDAAVALPLFTVDQRGVHRPQGSAPDIGAFEAVGLPTPPPQVVRVQRLGTRTATTQVVISFSRPLDPARAAAPGNYLLIGPGPDGRFGTRDDVRAPIRSARYDPTTNTVTLVPASPLPARGVFALFVNGQPPAGVAGANGALLDGDGDGVAGGNYLMLI